MWILWCLEIQVCFYWNLLTGSACKSFSFVWLFVFTYFAEMWHFGDNSSSEGLDWICPMSSDILKKHMHKCDHVGFNSLFPRQKYSVKPSTVPIYVPHWGCPSSDCSAPEPSKACVLLLEADLPWSYGHHREIWFSFLQGRVHLASKYHLLEVVSTLNVMKHVGHLWRAARFVLLSVFTCRGCGMRPLLNCARFGMLFWSIEGNSFNIYSTVVEFTRRTVFNQKKKREKDWKKV